MGVFTAVTTYVSAVWQQVIPLSWSSALVMLGTFVFAQGIGWTLTGAATFVHQYLVPLALTFVLVLGVPTAGAPASADMLPTVLGKLHDVMPLGQFITLVGSLAYGVGSPLHFWLVLVGWLAVGAILCALAARRTRTASTGHQRTVAGGTRRTETLHGFVVSLSGAPVPRAAVRVIDDDTNAMLRTVTDDAGSYSIDAVPEGLHHILVTAAHAEPQIVTAVIRQGDGMRHDFVMQDWVDPAVNLTAESTGERVHK